MRVLRLPGESAVQRIIELIESAREQKAPAQRFTDTFTRYYTVAVLGAAACFFSAGCFTFRQDPFAVAIYHMMTLLVVASPCALVLSIPSAILVAIAAGARNGILFRGGVAVETLAGVNHFAFDKTGTLTTGELEVSRIETAGLTTADEALAAAAAVAQDSTHPLSRAVVAEAQRRALPPVETHDVVNIPGFGMEARIDAGVVAVGSRRLMEQRGFEVAGFSSSGAEAEVWVARGTLCSA